MAIKEQDKVFYEEAENGDKVINLPVTRANNVEGLGRSANTAYSVGNVVYVDSNLSVALKCTTAGTTSNTELDISGNNVGDSVTDGGVVWKVVNRDLSEELKAEATKIQPIELGGTGNTEGKAVSAGILNATNLGKMVGKTSAELKALVIEWMNSVAGSNYASCCFSANLPQLMKNIDDDNYVVADGGVCSVQYIGSYPLVTTAYAQLMISTYSDREVYFIAVEKGKFLSPRKIAYNGALSMPSNNYVTISQCTEYVAPSDGWIHLQTTATATGYTQLYGVSSLAMFKVYHYASGHTPVYTLPVTKGETVKFALSNTNWYACRFIYAQSEV